MKRKVITRFIESLNHISNTYYKKYSSNSFTSYCNLVITTSSSDKAY